MHNSINIEQYNNNNNKFVGINIIESNNKYIININKMMKTIYIFIYLNHVPNRTHKGKRIIKYSVSQYIISCLVFMEF